MRMCARLAFTASLVTHMAVSLAAPVAGQGTWETTLKARDIAGNAVSLDSADAAFFYDTTLNVTWLADMNAAAGSGFDDGVSGTDGDMTWPSAQAWADSLSYFGGGWRLPNIIDSGEAGCDFSLVGGTDCGYNTQTRVGNRFSEWSHLFYVTLGNLSAYDTSGNLRPGQAGVDFGLTNSAYFQNMLDDFYWSGTEYALMLPDGTNGWWAFDHRLGQQRNVPADLVINAVAVRDGDVLQQVGTVPEPQTLALALAALAGLGFTLRRRRAA